ncbi:hypothetical protein [Caldisalinibacter kiritimatiensis]|uniref:Uncharacterized protein n=1 Tax=Caldisalinibacter kiritimatiensis TaxID=1304284 RepID=R1CAE1_9FIRM|nr:hypothetical protein [Caldisalinibacter kiritimatiensis]EOC99294.1 hypothetical protein L21TH_2678 [Caldisalinibacter kiritimatiensis]
MDLKSSYNSIIVILMTALTVVIMLNLQIDADISREYDYDKVNTKEKFSEITPRPDYKKILNEEIRQRKLLKNKETNIPIKTNKEEPVRLKESNSDVINKEENNSYIIFKQKQIVNSIENSFVKYDRKTIRYLLSQLEKSIKEAKLKQVKKLLNQNNMIQTVEVSKVQQKLTTAEKNELSDILNKIGAMNNVKLMYKINDGITPEEQQDIYDILKDKLSDDEVVRLHDILGKYMVR